MAREGDKWRVVRGDCLWNIAKSVYNNPYKWTAIADANGIRRSNPIIYPGQLLTLPNVSGGGSGGGSTPAPAPVDKKVRVDWWALDAGTDRQMFCTWSYNREHTAGYNIEVWYDTGSGGWRRSEASTVDIKQTQASVDESAKKIQLKIKPYSEQYSSGSSQVYYWTDGEWVTVEYDFSNNPPNKPDVPDVELDGNTLTITLSNIAEDINADSIEFAIYNNDTIKYKTGTAKINKETRYVSFVTTVEDNGSYTVRCRAVRNNKAYSDWTDFTSPVKTKPTAPKEITVLKPQVISEQGAKQYAVSIEWTPVTNAKQYEIQWTTNIIYFDSGGGDVQSTTTEEGQGPKALLTGIELGHEYFFRVRALNDNGESGWTGIKSTTLGSQPSPPTTWSSTTNCIIGEDMNLYWVHNSTDGSLETIATIHFTIINSKDPSRQPLEKDIVVHNNKPENEQDKASVYTVNTNDKEWATLGEGFILKWKVKTAGVIQTYSEWSVEREINVYARPELELELTNSGDVEVNEITSFPFYLKTLAKPTAQRPISYYIEVVSNGKYQTIDQVGTDVVINVGDIIYQRYYDPTSDNPWEFILEFNPGNIDLQNGINYTLNCTVSMDSGLSASNTLDFDVHWNDLFYDVSAAVTINKETLEANIQPFCNEYYVDDQGVTKPKLAENCTLSVYRREYDGTFTLIESGISNSKNIYVTDPHPALDYARYRITAVSNDTGSISFGDVQGVKVGEPSVVIQWSEAWSVFEMDSEGTGFVEPAWSGSMVRIPYNVDTSESTDVDVEMIEYVGRKHPVSYYGTHVGETAQWNVEIPRDDKETIYALRRLAKWTGDCYVREPSGVGYWANVKTSFSTKHLEVTIPVSFSITRVEGGI